MSNTSLLLSNPSVTLFAYHLCQDLSMKTDQLCDNADTLWKYCANLSQADRLGISELKNLPEKIESYQQGQVSEQRYHELLGKDGWELSAPTSYPLIVCIYPVKIHDTYALDFTLYREETNLPTQVFQDLNLARMFLNDSVQASLGQTLMLYAEPLNSPDLDRQVADSCVDSFLGKVAAASLFARQGRLLSGRMFEYDNLETDPCKQIHILVWLNRNPDAQIGNLKRRFINLLCCRSKALFAFHTANTDYNCAREVNFYLEQRAKEFPALAQSTARRNQFKQVLEEIPPQSFVYSNYLRSLRNHLTTVEFNAKNYAYWLGTIQDCLSPGDDLSFLADFQDRIEQTFLPQIQAYLCYLSPGQEKYSQMIESIRGLVELEEAESDRRLEATIQIVSVALGVGGLVASSSPSSLQEKPITLFPQQQPFTVFPHIHPFAFSCLIILLSAGAAALTTNLLISVLRKK